MNKGQVLTVKGGEGLPNTNECSAQHRFDIHITILIEARVVFNLMYKNILYTGLVFVLHLVLVIIFTNASLEKLFVEEKHFPSFVQ